MNEKMIDAIGWLVVIILSIIAIYALYIDLAYKQAVIDMAEESINITNKDETT